MDIDRSASHDIYLHGSGLTRRNRLKSLVKSAGGQITGEDDNEVQSVGTSPLLKLSC